MPRTLYGVYKVANEGCARVYWQDHGISSTALRPYTVYGVGRDQGITSEPTKALRAVSRGESYHINFGGTMQFHWASDVAQQFITAATQTSGGAYAFNLGMKPVSVGQFIDTVKELEPSATITFDDKALPFPEGFDASALHAHAHNVFETPLEDGIKATLEHFKALCVSVQAREVRLVRFAYTIIYVPDVANSLAFFEQAFGLSKRFLHASGDYGELDTGQLC